MMFEIIQVTKAVGESEEIFTAIKSSEVIKGDALVIFCPPGGCPPGDVCGPSTGQPCGPECIPAACPPAR